VTPNLRVSSTRIRREEYSSKVALSNGEEGTLLPQLNAADDEQSYHLILLHPFTEPQVIAFLFGIWVGKNEVFSSSISRAILRYTSFYHPSPCRFHLRRVRTIDSSKCF